MAHSPVALDIQARQLCDGATLFITEQVVILVRGHVHRRMPHELAHCRQVAAFAKERGREQVPDVVKDHVVGNFSAFAGRLEGHPKLFDGPAGVFDQILGLGAFLHLSQPGHELGGDWDHPCRLGLGGEDLDGRLRPVDVSPFQGEEFGFPSADAQVPGDLDGPGEMRGRDGLDLHKVSDGQLRVPGLLFCFPPVAQRVLFDEVLFDPELKDGLQVGQIPSASDGGMVGVGLAHDRQDLVVTNLIDGSLGEDGYQVFLQEGPDLVKGFDRCSFDLPRVDIHLGQLVEINLVGDGHLFGDGLRGARRHGAVVLDLLVEFLGRPASFPALAEGLGRLLALGIPIRDVVGAVVFPHVNGHITPQVR